MNNEAKSAQDVDRIFVRAMNSGDIETVMSLYNEDTVFVRAPGQQSLSGMENLRAELQGFLALNPRLDVELKQFVQAGDTALISVRWRLRGTDVGGNEIIMNGIDANVLRRQADGTWLTLIDNPFHAEFIREVELTS